MYESGYSYIYYTLIGLNYTLGKTEQLVGVRHSLKVTQQKQNIRFHVEDNNKINQTIFMYVRLLQARFDTSQMWMWETANYQAGKPSWENTSTVMHRP